MKKKFRVPVLMLVVILISIFIFTNNYKSVSASADKKITVGMSGGYYPFTFLEDNKLQGFDVDTWNEIGKRTGYDVEFKTASFSGLFGMLDSGKIDTISNQISVTEERKEKYYFSTPYVYTGAQIIVQKGNPQKINSFEDLKGKIVGVDLGTNYEQIIKAKDTENKIKVVTYQGTAYYQELLMGRIDAVVIDKLSAISEINDKGLELEPAGELIEPIENAFPFKKNDQNKELVEKVNKAVEDMKDDGTFKALSEKWLKTDVTAQKKTGFLKTMISTIISGAGITISLAVIAMIIGLIIGILIAVIRMFNIPVLNQLCRIYISFFRGTPLLVQLFLLYFGLPEIFPVLKDINAYTAAFIGLGLNSSSYIAEVMRGAISAIDKGQMEACLAMGMTKMQGLKRVVFPQAVRVAIPSLGNIFIDNIKSSSLAFTLGVTEMLAKAQMFAASNYRFFESYIAVAVMYWILITIFNKIQFIVERKLSAY